MVGGTGTKSRKTARLLAASVRFPCCGWLGSARGAPVGRWSAYGFVTKRKEPSQAPPYNAVTRAFVGHGGDVMLVARDLVHRDGSLGEAMRDRAFRRRQRWRTVCESSTELRPESPEIATVHPVSEPGAAEITPKPATGRIFENTRRIRLAEVDPTGRCRLDATVRHLQDVARDDSTDSGLTDPMTWVVRRTMLDVHRAPVFQEQIALATWCSGHGGGGPNVHRDPWRRGCSCRGGDDLDLCRWRDGAPRKLNDDFFDIYGSATERKVSARLQLPNQAPDHASERAWPIRFVDLDVLGHVNNAAQWAPVEEVAHRTGMKLEGVRAQLEHGGETPPGSATIRWWGCQRVPYLAHHRGGHGKCGRGAAVVSR